MSSLGASESAPAPDAHPQYATFPRRLNALTADGLILIGITLIVVALTPRGDDHPVLRMTLAFVWWGSLILYEPLLVALWGGTLGHRLMNLRVVDDKSGANVSIAKAFGRYVTKAFLGILSFFTMSFSRRHQALHDIVTSSTVQIRDPSKASRHHYVHEREGQPPPAGT